MVNLRKEWVEASTIILMALQRKPYVSPYNYKILSLKRSGRSSFMPSGYVFPGGAVDPIDSNKSWLDAFKAQGVSDSVLSRVIINSKNLPELFQDQSNDQVPKQISLRITAIRETFEETGVLLCRSGEPKESLPWGSTLCTKNLAEWRSKVQKDASAFLEMCFDLQIVPDIWGLKLWSNWLTPPGMKKRFDTSFYTVCLHNEPESCADGSEIEKLVWQSPFEILAANSKKNLWLPPPQQYELSRILPFCMLEDLASFAHEREQHGLERYGGPDRLLTKDGMLFVLPGDDLFDEIETGQYKDKTSVEVRNLSTHVHRLEMTKNNEHCKVVAINVEPRFGHILPFTEDSPS